MTNAFSYLFRIRNYKRKQGQRLRRKYKASCRKCSPTKNLIHLYLQTVEYVENAKDSLDVDEPYVMQQLINSLPPEYEVAAK